MFNKKYDNSGDLARTLDSEDIGNNNSGWIIRGKIVSDYYEWVNEFEAFHNDYGFVFGDFEDVVYASSEEAFNHFLKNHHYSEWDYQDI